MPYSKRFKGAGTVYFGNRNFPKTILCKDTIEYIGLETVLAVPSPATITVLIGTAKHMLLNSTQDPMAGIHTYEPTKPFHLRTLYKTGFVEHGVVAFKIYNYDITIPFYFWCRLYATDSVIGPVDEFTSGSKFAEMKLTKNFHWMLCKPYDPTNPIKQLTVPWKISTFLNQFNEVSDSLTYPESFMGDLTTSNPKAMIRVEYGMTNFDGSLFDTVGQFLTINVKLTQFTTCLDRVNLVPVGD